MSPTETTENKFDLSTKLLGGSFLGLGIGFDWFIYRLSSGTKEPLSDGSGVVHFGLVLRLGC